MAKVTCEHCEKSTTFEWEDAQGLDEYLDASLFEKEAEIREEYEDHINPAEISLDILFADLLLAIRFGDSTEAERLFHCVAEELRMGEAMYRLRFSSPPVSANPFR